MLPTPAVVEQHTQQDEDNQSQGAQDGEQEKGVICGDIPQARVTQPHAWKTNQTLFVKYKLYISLNVVHSVQ